MHSQFGGEGLTRWTERLIVHCGLGRCAALLGLLLACAVGGSSGLQPEAYAARTVERVRIPFPNDDGTLTPYTFQTGYPLMTLIYDTLMWRDASGTPRPWLLRSLRKDDAGRRLTIRLREGVRWHDGKPLTAADVAFSFDLFRSRRPHLRFTPQLADVSSVDALDRSTVVITRRRASLGFTDQPLSDVPILPRHLWRNLPAERAAPPGLPIGSGPYRLVAYRPGQGYRFERNRGYFLGPPRVKRIDVPVFQDFNRTVRALEQRRIDMIPVSLSERAAERLRGTSFKTATGDFYSGTVLMFNLRRPPFDRPEARRAVATALSLDRLARATGGEETLPADRGYFHPESRWATLRPVHRFDRDRARAALKALRLPPIPVLAPDSDPVRLEAGRQVVLALERAGARARLEEVPQRRLSSAVGEDGSQPAYTAAIWNSPPQASYDPDFLRQVFGSAPNLAPLNFSGYRSTRFDRLAQRVASVRNPDDRRRAVRLQLKTLARDLPVVPLFYPEGRFVYRPARYDGWVFVRGTGILDKRSFLAQPGGPPGRPSETPAATTPEAGLGILGLIGLGLLALTAAAVVAGLLSGGRGRRRRAGRR